MRVILAGTRSFGRAALETIAGGGHELVAVVAPPPEGDNLGDRLWNCAFSKGYDVYPNLEPDWVAAKQADLIVCAHSHNFVGEKTRRATKLGALVGHPSLLPRHRGKDAVEWTVRMKDAVGGFSWFWADRNVDTGPIAKQDWCFVQEGEDASALWKERLFGMGQRLLAETLKDLENGVLVAVPQPEQYATWEPSLDGRRLHRPELPELGAGPAGYTLKVTRE